MHCLLPLAGNFTLKCISYRLAIYNVPIAEIETWFLEVKFDKNLCFIISRDETKIQYIIYTKKSKKLIVNWINVDYGKLW